MVETPRTVACVIPQVLHGINTEVTVAPSSELLESNLLSYPLSL